MDRAQLIAAMQATAAQKPVAVPTKAWGTVFVRPVTVAEVDEEQQGEAGAKPLAGKSKLARGACRVICTEAGERIFDPSNEADVELLASQPWALLRQLLTAADGDPGNG